MCMCCIFRQKVSYNNKLIILLYYLTGINKVRYYVVSSYNLLLVCNFKCVIKVIGFFWDRAKV